MAGTLTGRMGGKVFSILGKKKMAAVRKSKGLKMKKIASGLDFDKENKTKEEEEINVGEALDQSERHCLYLYSNIKCFFGDKIL